MELEYNKGTIIINMNDNFNIKCLKRFQVFKEAIRKHNIDNVIVKYNNAPLYYLIAILNELEMDDFLCLKSGYIKFIHQKDTK